MNYRVIESDPYILSFTSRNGSPLWFYMRNYLLIYLLPQKMNLMSELSKPRKMNTELISYFFRALLYNIRKSKLIRDKHSVVFYTPCRGITEAHGFRNTYCDDFALSDSSYLVLENAPVSWKWPGKRLNQNTYYYSLNYALHKILARFTYTKEKKQVSLLSEYIKKRVSNLFHIELTNEEVQWLIRVTCQETLAMEEHSKWILNKCRKMCTKILVIPGASHSNYCYLNREAKKNGITVIEIQHGLITKNADIINYSNELCKDKRLKESSPDYFFSFGEWWNSQTNIPFSNKISIGSIQRDRNRANKKQDEELILFIGGGNKTEELFKLADFVAGKLKEKYKVMFRPHPIERNAVEEIRHSYSSVEIDYNENVYETLSRCKSIIGEASTVLYEAIGIVNKIFVWNTSYAKSLFQDIPFQKFETGTELLDLLESTDVSNVIKESLFWQNNAVHNFINCIKNIELKGNNNVNS